MVRKRGVARRSFARRRARRVKKYDHHVIPKRFKIYLPRMSELLEEELPLCVLCEEPTMALLLSLGVQTSEWQYYLGFMKRMVELYLTFTSETLQMEKDSLITEYVYRGKDKDVLEQVQDVAEGCVGILSCETVFNCLEPDLSTWIEKWQQDFPEGHNTWWDVSMCFSPLMVYIAYVDASGWDRFVILKMTDGSVQFASPVGADYLTNPTLQNATFFVYNTVVRNYYVFSIRGKYVILKTNAGNVEIWKDGVLIFTLPDASVVVAGASFWWVYGISPSGKHVIAVTDTKKIVCFEGS